uniref:C2H2-type domain-containing protein n=1 Tax=Trichobilharzia regenti TaxID=157069 RepID=A0AA85JY81_TRIRE|nr:unnamed protein product [Trichobilharzia regenti]CAH8829412.1 unnamed protein product [Trichobilharzia regenti]
MKSSKDSNGSLHLDSIPNKAVRENCGDKINKRNTVIGNMCHAVVSQKPTNEMKGKLSDNKNTSFSTTELSSLSSPPRTSECTHKPRRSLVDWDSFINLPKKQRNLSFRTGDPSRSVLTKTTPPALTSPVKLKQDYDKDCVLPVKTNDSTGKSPLTSPRSSSLQDKPCSPSSRSSYDKNPKRNAFAKKEDLPYAFKSDRISPPFVTKKPTESKKHRLSLFTADLTNCILLADGKDVKSQKGSHEQNHIYSSDSKKRKLSPSVFSCKMKKSSSILMKGSQCNGLLSTNSHPDKNRTRKKLYEINQFYESPSMFPATSSLVENVDDEISIRNGVISPGNYSLLNGHSGDDCKSPQYSYSKKSTVPASNDSKLKSVTPPWATRSTFSDDDSSIKIVNTTSDNTSPSQNKDLNSSKHHLSSKIHPSKLTEKDVWHNYRPPHNGPYTCSFCGQVIHKRSNFSKHLLTCKPRLSINDTEKMKSLSQKKKQKLHSLLKSCSKMSSKSDDVMKRLTRRILLHTAKNKKCDTSVNHVMENSSYETSDIFSSHDDTKDVSSCIESSHKSCLPTPIRSVCDTNEDFSDIFKDSTTPTTSKMKASRDLENERSVSEHKSNESLDEDNDSSVRTLRRTRVREMRTSTDKAKMIRRTSSKKLSKSETMCSPSSKVAEEQFDFTGSDTTSECSRAQISEDKPEDSNRNKSDNSLFRSPNGLKTTDKEFSITKSSSLFKCDACSVEYSLQRLLSLHMRGKQHRLNVMKNELLMNESDKCDSEPVGNIIPDVVSNVCEKSVLVNPPVINNNEVVELPETSRHSITSEDDDDDNETLSKLSEKLKSSTIPNKNILNLETGKNSHWEFIESSRIESKDKTASFETDQQKHLSQTPKKSITVSSTSVFVCDTCSHPFRHRGSLLRHQRKTNHRNYNDSDKNPPSVPAIVPSTEILGQFCENNNMMEAISDLISEEYTDLVLTETTIVESNNNNDSNIILVKDVADSSHCESQNHKFPGLEISTINPFVSPQKGITTPMMNEKHPQSDTVVTPFFKREETVSKAYNAFNTDVIKEEETEYLLRASDTTPVDDVTAHSELTSTQSQNQSNETDQHSSVSHHYKCPWCDRVIRLFHNFTRHTASCKDRFLKIEVQEKPVVDSENLSSMDDSTIPTEKPYSICLRRRSMSIQSNEGKKTSKRSSVKKTTGNSDSLPATPSTDEIVKSRRSSVSTLSSSDNFIDDAKSVISNATTIPASDEMNKDDPELSTVPSCPWCNKSGYSCLRILHIHQSRCPLRPKSIEEHKSPVPNKEIDKQVITNFICEECSRGFSSSTGLKVHCSMVKHKYTEQKPVPDDTFSQYIGCPGCSRDAPLFDSTEKLLKHLLTLKSGSGNNHTSRSQRWPTVLQVPNLGYGCHICGLLLASESRLDKHKKAVHEAWLLEEQQKISPGKLPQSCGNSS